MFFIIVQSVQFIFAQEARQYAFTHYTVNNGLAAYNVSNITQDDQGFMWISTVNGLQRFDGTRFITFRHVPSDPNSIPDNFITQLVIDKQKNLWLLFGNGDIGIFDTRRFTFKKAVVKLKNDNNLKRMRHLDVDSDGNQILVFTFAEVVTYNKQSNEFSSVYNTFNIPSNWRVTNIIDDGPSKKYLLCCDSGLVAYNKVTRTISYRNHNIDHEPLIEKFGHLSSVLGYMIDSKKRFWFMNWPPTGACRLYCFDMSNNTALLDQFALDVLVHQYNEPGIMKELKDGNIWICGLNVFAKYEEKEKTFIPVKSDYSNGQGIYYESVNLFEDRDRNLWANTSNNGIYVFNPSKQLFNSIGHINRIKNTRGEGGVMSFIQTNNSELLTGCWGDGLYRYDSNFRSIKLGIKGIEEVNGLTVWGMCHMNDTKTICMVGQPAFVLFYDQLTGDSKKYEPAIFENRTIRKVVQDKYGNLWFGSHSHGIYKWDAAKAIQNYEDGFYKIDAIPNVKILSLVTDSRGFIWVGTEIYGVYKIDPVNDKIVEHYFDKGPAGKRLSANGAAALLEYNDSIMIIGGGGLNILNTKRNNIVNISASDGLPSDMVVTLQKDRAGYLWIGMMTGLCRMNMDKKTFTFYDRNDGMANDLFDVGASYQLPNGKMLFGTSNDFVVFDPMDIKTTTQTPGVYITDFKILNNAVSVDSLVKLDRIELLANQNSISIGFSSLSYFSQNKVMYFYMMEGIDKEWKQANELNQAIYNYLPAGTYTFKVKTETADLVGSKKITELKIKVNPPFWKTWWFILLVILLFSFLLYWLDRLQMKKKEGLQKIRSEIADNLHNEVNMALNNINILSEMARIKADSEPLKSKEYIEQIHSKSHNMIIAMDDMLWSLSPENDSMQKTVERMREYIDALRNRHGTNIEITVDKKVESLELDMKFRHEAFILFKETIKSLVHAGTKNCFIQIGLGKSTLLFTMQFDNANCDMQGLNNLLHRHDLEKHMQMLNAKLDVQVHKGNSVFVLEMPIA
ncbi:MAG: triple tyrosine motif-containing protein [Ferruginibacter sp.]